MPPTDLVKKLSRSDHIFREFIKFLLIQGILREGDEDILINAMPYTTTIPFIYNNKVKLYYCMALSVCVPSIEIKLENDYVINFKNSKISCSDKVSFNNVKSSLYIHDIVNKTLDIVTFSRIKKVKVLDTTFKNFDVILSSRTTFNGVYGISLYGENGLVLSLASSEPMVIELAFQKAEVYVPRTQLMIISTTPHTKIFRDVLVHNSVGIAKGLLRNTQALIEILDPIVLGIVEKFSEGCVDMLLVNPENLDFNTIVKVYGYIEEIVVDDLAKFKPKHSVVRIAMASYSKSRVRICMSTSIPKRSEMFLRVKAFEQVFSQL